MHRCLVLFSGGLDSTIACHLLKTLGLEVIAVHFILPFKAQLGFSHSEIQIAADALSVHLIIEEEGEEFVEMVSSPQFGFGKNANPCMDCRIFRLKKAKEIMHTFGASFIATGEVVGQRPQSQRKDCMFIIEKRTDLKGLLLRPLSAQLLPPTLPEQTGIVDRSRLFCWKGRGRVEQLHYAQKYNLSFTPPAGGCVLTNSQIAERFYDLKKEFPRLLLNDFKLLPYGRHFRLRHNIRLIIGRNEAENTIIQRLSTGDDILLEMNASKGPVALLRGEQTLQLLELAASIVARYAKDKNSPYIEIIFRQNGINSIIKTKPVAEKTARSYLLIGQ